MTHLDHTGARNAMLVSIIEQAKGMRARLPRTAGLRGVA